jgi:hypothetical protein
MSFVGRWIRRVLSFGVWRHIVRIKFIDISEEHTVRSNQTKKHETQVSPCLRLVYFSTLKTETVLPAKSSCTSTTLQRVPCHLHMTAQRHQLWNQPNSQPRHSSLKRQRSCIFAIGVISASWWEVFSGKLRRYGQKAPSIQCLGSGLRAWHQWI